MLWTNKESRFLRLKYAHIGPKNLAPMMKRGWRSIYDKAQRMGIKMIPGHKHDRNCAVTDVARIIEPKTPEACYLLGLIWADGHLQKTGLVKRGYEVSFSLKTPDFKEILPVLMSTSSDWRIYARPNHNTIALLTGRSLHGFLVRMDYYTKSVASPGKILSRMPDEMKHYFWRGFFDGDGYINSKPRAKVIVIAGHFRQDWSDWIQLCLDLGIHSKLLRVRYRHMKYSKLVINRRVSIAAFGDYILKGRQFGLTRKHIKFSQIMPLAA